jgi:MYXO-CTERM domain-containing protein
MPAAFAVAPDAAVEATILRHGLPRGVPDGDRVVHNLGHELQGHAGALLHPQSSRKIAAATPTQPVAEEAEEPPARAGQTPGPDVAALLLVGLGAAWGVARRRP